MMDRKKTPKVDYVECYVAFLDILGFKDLVFKSKTDPELRAKLVHTLRTAATLSETHHAINNYEDAVTERFKTQIRAFSDCVALFIPTKTGALADLLRKVRYLHDRLLELGVCIRGAVTVGEMYWDDAWSPAASKDKSCDSAKTNESQAQELFNRDAPSRQSITLGPALVEAHKLESEVAIYPRTIFSPCLMSRMQKVLSQAREKNDETLPESVRPFPLYIGNQTALFPSLLDFVRTDFDSVPFLDMFHEDIDRNDTERIERVSLPDGKHGVRWIRDGMTHDKFMCETRDRIASLLTEHTSEKVRVKYLWLANYFNNSLGPLQITPLPIEWGH